LHWQDRNSFKRSGHRPDLVALRDSSRFAIEVELAGKSRPRLDAILKLHDDWICGGKIGGVIYICGNEEGQRRVARSAHRVARSGASCGLSCWTRSSKKRSPLVKPSGANAWIGLPLPRRR
jgi:hypothetical protein